MPATTASIRLHASCAAIGNAGCLLLGPSGSGKSDLLLRLMEDGATLVADDQVMIETRGDALYARPPEKLAGLMEVRGLGIVTQPYTAPIQLQHAIQLCAPDAMERMPAADFYDCIGRKLPLHYLHAFELSAPLKVRLLMTERPLCSLS